MGVDPDRVAPSAQKRAIFIVALEMHFVLFLLTRLGQEFALATDPFGQRLIFIYLRPQKWRALFAKKKKKEKTRSHKSWLTKQVPRSENGAYLRSNIDDSQRDGNDSTAAARCTTASRTVNLCRVEKKTNKQTNKILPHSDEELPSRRRSAARYI